MKLFLKRLLFFGILFFAINFVFEYFYGMSTRKAIKEKEHKILAKWEDIHNNQGKYDFLILGSSRAYTGYNPKIIDSLLHVKSYNMATPSQDITETYYVLKEILCFQKPKVVLLDNFIQSIDKNISYYPILTNASFMECPENKNDLILKGFGLEGLANYFTPILKYKNHIKNDLISILNVNEALVKKETRWYKGHEMDSTIISPKEILSLEPIPNLSSTNVDYGRFELYFSKILQLAEENNIKLIATRTPYPPQRMKISVEDEVHHFYSDFYESKKITFLDLNNIADFKMKNENFSDFHHLNVSGARKVTIELCKLIEQAR